MTVVWRFLLFSFSSEKNACNLCHGKRFLPFISIHHLHQKKSARLLRQKKAARNLRHFFALNLRFPQPKAPLQQPQHPLETSCKFVCLVLSFFFKPFCPYFISKNSFSGAHRFAPCGHLFPSPPSPPPPPRAPTHTPQPPSAQQRHEGEGRGFVLRSPKDGLSAGTWRRKVVMCPRRGNDPASGHPRAHQPPLGRGTSPPAWDARLDAPGQRRRHLPSSAWTRRGEVKQGKSGGSVGTNDQGKGKGRSVVRPMGTTAYGGKGQGKGKGRGEGRLGQGGRGRSKGGEKPMGTTAYGGKGSKGRAANGDRPVGAASCRRDHHTMASCQSPPAPPHNA